MSSLLATRDIEHQKALRAIGIVELLKGIAALAFALWLFSSADRDFFYAAATLLNTLHVAPGGRLAFWMFDLAAKISPEKIHSIANFGLFYAGLRFVEAYGLIRARVWAEWFAIFSCSVYIPFEIFEIIRGSTVPRWIVLLINASILAYMIHLRYSARRKRARLESHVPEFAPVRRAS
jgi:uncharacterized membrane protein (DUF2068 family)